MSLLDTWTKLFSNFQWQNRPSTSTPLGRSKLQLLNDAIDGIDDRVLDLKGGVDNITTALDDKVDKEAGKGLSTEDFTTEEKTKLAGISAQANKVEITPVVTEGTTLATISIDGVNTDIKGSDIDVDDEMSPTSENPVQNKVIYETLQNILPEETAEGNPISITDASGLNAKSCEATFSPIQDLHGQSAPYPAGGGKNKADCTVRASSTVNEITSEIKANNEIVASGTSTGNGDIDFDLSTQISIQSGQAFTISLSGTDTRSGTLTIFGYTTNYILLGSIPSNVHTLTYTPTDDISISKFKLRTSNTQSVNIDANFQLELGDTATPFAPYSNICPISGRTEASVTRTGVNQWDEVTEVGGISEANGSLNTNANFLRSKNTIRMSHNMTYYVYSKKGNQAVLYYYDENMNYLGFKIATNIVVTPPEDTYYARMRTPNFGTTIYENGDLSVNYPSTDTEYHAYNGQTHTATFPDTVYGGSYDFVSGNGSAKNVIVTFDGTETGWSYTPQGGVNTFRIARPSDISGTTLANSISNMFKYNPLNTNIDGTFYFGAQNMVINHDSIDNLGDWKSFLASNNLQICYELATPTEITLTPETIALLKGNNVLFTDVDSVKLVYSADIKAYIDSQLNS